MSDAPARASSTATVLVIDDDPLFGDALRRMLEPRGYRVLCAENGERGVRLCRSERVDVALLDQKLPDGEGLELCKRLLEVQPDARVVLTTAFPTFPSAVRAMKEGAYDYLPKPIDPEHLLLLLQRAVRSVGLERRHQLLAQQRSLSGEPEQALGASAAWRAVLEQVELARRSRSPVLVTGETGTGKNLVARLIAAGREGAPPMVEVNCAAIPENLLEGEFFGHDAGAFTGATSARPGLFELADGGTIFLDEIGELAPHLQAKLLGVLDSGTVRRLGGRTSRHVDVRIVAATNVDIDRAVEEGRFRRDLYYRLAVIRIHLPPLRERREDVPALCHHFLRRFSGPQGYRLGEEELATLQAYDWPGNVRELRNVMERAVLLREGLQVRPSALLPGVDRAGRESGGTADGCREGASASSRFPTLEEVRRRHVAEALRRNGYNVSRAARALGVSRSTLQRMMRRWGMRREDEAVAAES